MLRTKLVVDRGGTPVQGALLPKKTTTISFSDTSAINTDPFTFEIVRLIATEDCYVVFGNAESVADSLGSMFIKAYLAEYFVNKEGYIAVIRVSANGSLNVTEME